MHALPLLVLVFVRDVVLGTRTQVVLQYKFSVLILVLMPNVLVLDCSVHELVLVLTYLVLTTF